jgi:alpha-galactosidase
MKRGQAAKRVAVDLHGVRSLLLTINHAGATDSQNLADVIDASFSYSGVPPRPVNAPREDAVVLTPKSPLTPRINSPKIYGCRPGNPFIFRIPTTGERPMSFSLWAADGLRLDAANGIITGRAGARKSGGVARQEPAQRVYAGC